MLLRVILVVASTRALPVEADGPSVGIDEMPIIMPGTPSCLTIPRSDGFAFADFVGVATQADSASCERLPACSLPMMCSVGIGGSGAIPPELGGG